MEKSGYDIRRSEIEELKERIAEYFKDNEFDITLSQLFNDLGLTLDNLDLLQYCLEELVNQGHIKKSASLDHFEYDLEDKK